MKPVYSGHPALGDLRTSCNTLIIQCMGISDHSATSQGMELCMAAFTVGSRVSRNFGYLCYTLRTLYSSQLVGS